MKRLVSVYMLLLLLVPGISFSASQCEDAESAAGSAAKARNNQARQALNQTMPAPEENRSGIASCLGAISALGSVFSLGVQTPSLEQIVEKMCSQVDSYIDQKINQSMGEIESGIGGAMGTNNPFQVNLNASDISKPLVGKLK